MKPSILLLSIFLAGNVIAAPVYECKEANGTVRYSQFTDKNCKPANLSGIGFATSSTPAPVSSYPTTAPASASPSPSTPSNQASIQAAQQQLQQAKAALEEGKAVRYGHERNFAKKLERIAGLEAVVKEKEQALQQLQNSTPAMAH